MSDAVPHLDVDCTYGIARIGFSGVPTSAHVPLYRLDTF